MDCQDKQQLHERASESYLRGDYRDALDAWQSVLTIDPGDEQALEGVRLAALLVEGSEPAAPPGAPASPDPAVLRRRLDEVDARLEASDLQGAASVAEALVAEFPSDPAVVDALNRARTAVEAEPFLAEQIALARAALDGGRVVEAEAACRRVLAVDSHHLEATSLLRRCAQTASSEGPDAKDLAVLDTLSSRLDSAMPNAGETAATSVAPPVPVLEPPREAGSGSPALELERRVRDLLEEAKRQEKNGRTDDALAILSRVFILDEQNVEAMAMEERLRAVQGQCSRDVENWLAEGSEAYETGKLDEARALFQKVLERYPGHLEALEFLEKTDSALAAKEGPAPGASPEAPLAGSPGEDLLSLGSQLEGGDASTPTAPRTFVAASSSSAIPLQHGAAPTDAAGDYSPFHPGGVAPEGAADIVVTPSVRPAPPPRRSSLPWPLLAGVAVLLAVVGVGAAGWYVVPLFRGQVAKAPAKVEAPLPPRPAPKPQPRPVEAAPAPIPGVKSPADAMARAKAAMEAGDYAGAVIAYNAALSLDPGLDDARTGLALAGERYKVDKAQRDQIDRARTMFAEGEYTPALKILYRIPQGRYGADIERHEANAWFNNGLVSLRGGNCKEALEHFAEALQIRPTDADFLRARNMAQKFQTEPKDRAYFDAAEGIPFRKFDE